MWLQYYDWNITHSVVTSSSLKRGFSSLTAVETYILISVLLLFPGLDLQAVVEISRGSCLFVEDWFLCSYLNRFSWHHSNMNGPIERYVLECNTGDLNRDLLMIASSSNLIKKLEQGFQTWWINISFSYALVEFKTCWSVVSSSGLVDQIVLAKTTSLYNAWISVILIRLTLVFVSISLHLKKKGCYKAKS